MSINPNFLNGLYKHFKKNDPRLLDAIGILTGTVICEFHEIGWVTFTLTEEERAEWLGAIMKSQSSWLLGHSVAHYMSPELETLVCGGMPERYTSIESPNPDKTHT